jgi:hypothetical protein
MGEQRVDYLTLRSILMEGDTGPSVFENALGFGAATTSYKGVHLMNDVAQTLLGGAPESGGDFLCRLIRLDKEGEDNTEPTLRADTRFGAAFNRAFPATLGPRRVEDLRRAADCVLNFDGGAYKPGSQMASALATHKALLGFEGFRRFAIGPYLTNVLTDHGRARLKALFESDRDPISRAFRPLLLDEPLVARRPPGAPAERTAFDRDLGDGLSLLLTQPLSKPTLLRAFVLASSVGLVLKLLGLGRADGRPLILALAGEAETRPLRSEAVVSFRRGVDVFDREIARLLVAHPRAKELAAAPKAKAEFIEVRTGQLKEIADDIIAAARGFRPKPKEKSAEKPKVIYWPDEFLISFGKKAGCILPRTDHAGWGKHLALTAEHLELLILMTVPPTAPPVPWTDFWRKIRDRFGLVVGANASADVAALEASGVHNVSTEELADNAEALLAQAVRRGVARRLPDGGADVGGDLT